MKLGKDVLVKLPFDEYGIIVKVRDNVPWGCKYDVKILVATMSKVGEIAEFRSDQLKVLSTVVLPTDEEANQMVTDYIESWHAMNPELDKDYHWSAVTEGVYLLLNSLKPKERKLVDNAVIQSRPKFNLPTEEMCKECEAEAEKIPTKDFYKLIATRIYEVPYDEVTPELRQEAKLLCFNIIYGNK